MSVDPALPDGGQDARMPSHTRPSFRFQSARRIERKAAAIERHTTAVTDAAAAAELATEASSQSGTPRPARKMTRLAAVVTGILGVPVLGMALIGALIAVGLGTEFWGMHLPASANAVKIFAVPFTVDLTSMTPVGFEGTIWALTMMATVLAVFGRRYAAFTRPMWAVATVIALINGIHNAAYDVIGGLGLGALSLSSPYLVHKYVLFVRSMSAGKTISESIADITNRWKFVGRIAGLVVSTLLDFLLHPIITISAVLLWRMHRDLPYTRAHRTVVAHLRARRADRALPKKQRSYHLSLLDLIDPTMLELELTAPVAKPRRAAAAKQAEPKPTTKAAPVTAPVAAPVEPVAESAPVEAVAPAAVEEHVSPTPAPEPVERADIELERTGQDSQDGGGRHAKNADIVDFRLAATFGEKRGRALTEWLRRLDENQGQGPAYAEIDKKLFGKVTKTTSQAVAAYIEKYGDPRTKAVNE